MQTINVKENYRPESAASEDLENGSEHSQTYSLEKLSLNNDGGSADNAPVFDVSLFLINEFVLNISENSVINYRTSYFKVKNKFDLGCHV